MKKFYNEKFNTSFEELRLKHGMSVNQVAKAVGINQPTLARYLSGETKLNLETACKLADYFNVSVDYIIGRE
ncbi:MAG: helix-turn-helix transcriptional regulator [Bacillota bacterium]